MKSFFAGSAVLLSCISLALAAPPTDLPGDYSHALPLTVSGKQAVVQLRLPPAVYQHARSERLHDLRLFDADGKAIPFSLQAPAPRQSNSRRDVPVRMFQVMASRNGGAPLDAQLDVRRSADGTLLSVTTHAAAGGRVGEPALASLVLDLGAPDPKTPIDALRFTLPAGTVSYGARIALEVSDDLKNWDTVGDSEVAWLVNAKTEALNNDRIEFAPRSFRYARLRWRDGTPLAFGSITAESPLATDVAVPVDKLELTPLPGKVAGDLVYAAAPAIPAHRVALRFSNQNVVMPAQLGHYVELPDPKGSANSTWRFDALLEASFYQLTQNGSVRSSGEIAITPTNLAEWVLRPATPGADKPVLMLSWIPSSIVFLANGKAPYSLAFGRADVKPVQRGLAQVAPGFSPDEILALESAVAGPLRIQHAAAANGPSEAAQAAAAARTRMLALWAVLLAGVGVLGYMAWRLVRQMR